MSKRTRTSQVEKWIEEGCGFAGCEDNKPWINIQDGFHG